MKVRIPSPLRSYTDQRAWVDGEGTTVDELLRDLDRCYPGMRFRIVDEQGRLRTHMKVWVNADSVRDLSTAIDADGRDHDHAGAVRRLRCATTFWLIAARASISSGVSKSMRLRRTDATCGRRRLLDRAHALPCEHDERAAAVGRALLSRDEATLLHPSDVMRQPALRPQHPRGELVEPPPVVVGLGQVGEHRVVGLGEIGVVREVTGELRG